MELRCLSCEIANRLEAGFKLRSGRGTLTVRRHSFECLSGPFSDDIVSGVIAVRHTLGRAVYRCSESIVMQHRQKFSWERYPCSLKAGSHSMFG